MSIYGDIILDHYHYPRNKKKLKKPTKSIHVDNPLCGDSLDMEVKESGGKITDIGFEGEGCAISMASASLLSEFVKGKPVTEITSLSKDTVIRLLNIELSPNRLKCALLPWEGLIKLVNK
jgi:nitrogen fixation NifU-like protein